jgi:hypothetical protein
MSGHHVIGSDMCRAQIMRATRPDPVCRGADPEILFSAETMACLRRAPATRTLPCPCKVTLLVRTLLVAVHPSSFPSAGRNIVLSTVAEPSLGVQMT